MRLTSLPSFIDRRFRVRDGFYRTGLFFSGVWSARINGNVSTSGITIKAAKTGYFGVGSDNSGNLRESVYLEAGESHRFTLFDHTEGSLLYIYQANRIKEIDLSEISISQSELVSFGAFTLAEKIILGGADHVNMGIGSYAPMTEPPLGSLPFLKELNIVNTLATAIDASQCPRLETLDATGSPLASLALAETSPVSVLTLPATISRLTLVNLPNLSYESGGLTFDGMSALTQIRIDGCPLLDGAKLLTDAVNAGATLTRIRLAGIDVTGKSDILVALRDMGVRGLDANGTAYDEVGQCSGMVGVWTCSDVIEAALLANLQAYFPLLTIYNAQYTAVRIDEERSTPDGASIINMDGNYYDGSGSGYKRTGHIEQIYKAFHVYSCVYDESAEKMVATKISDEDIEVLYDGSSFSPAAIGGDNDIMVGIPHFWYKGINDRLNQKKYLILSSEASTPRSSATQCTRALQGSLLLATGVGVYPSAFEVGDVFDVANLGSYSAGNTYKMDVGGMKQVRWPGTNDSTRCLLFLDEAGVVLSKFTSSYSTAMDDSLPGDYMFYAVPVNAKWLVFSSLAAYDDMECIAVNSSEVEAIEPDWVEHELELIGTYEGCLDGSKRLRSVSGQTPVGGTGTQTTNPNWQYNPDTGELLTTLTDVQSWTFNRTMCDLRNLALCRGKGYQITDYEQHKIVAILFMAFYGVRHSQDKWGVGQGGSAVSGNSNVVTTVIDGQTVRDASPLREAVYPRFMGLENWWSNKMEFMDNVAINVSSWSDFVKSKLTSGLAQDAMWHINMPDGTERVVKGYYAGNNNRREIARLRWGRYCDVIPSWTIEDSSNTYQTYYCDQQDFANASGRVVARSGSGGYASYGLVFVYAGVASSSSGAVYGARLAFRGEIELVE